MRRRNGKRLLAGILCVVMIFSSGAAAGISVRAAEINLPVNEAAAELPDGGTEPGGKTPAEGKDEQAGSEESTGESGGSSEGSTGEIGEGGDETGGDQQEIPGGEDSSGETEGSKEEEGDKEESGIGGAEGSGDESGEGETEKPDDSGEAGEEEDAVGSDVETPEGEGEEIPEEESAEPEHELTTSADDIASGVIDEEYGHITWVIDRNGKLTVEGTGDCRNYTKNTSVPWYKYRDTILTAEIKVSGMKSANKIFRGCENLISIKLNGFDTSTITDMSYMFYGCTNLSNLDISNFNTTNVTDMSYMFFECRNLFSLDVSNFNTHNVTNMECMFAMANLVSNPGESSLIDLNLSGLDTSNVTNMNGMFNGCCKLKRLDVQSFNTDKVTSMRRMFFDCNVLTDLNVENFDIGNVTDTSQMFGCCYTLDNLNVSNFNTKNVVYMDGMFSNCHNISSLDVSNFKTENVISMSGMFFDCENLKSLNLDNFDTKKVTDMSFMFGGCYGLTSLNLSNFDTSNVVNMECMFAMYSQYDSNSLTELNLSNFDTRNVTDMRQMFEACDKLLDLDLSSFQTGGVTEMQGMFDGCNSLCTLDISSFNTENVINMRGMFNECTSLRNLNLRNFYTKNVTDMGNMFYECSSLESLDVSNFNTEKVTYMAAMFSGCSNLRNLDLSSFDISNVTNISDIFYNCDNLVTLDISSFDMSHINQDSLKRYWLYLNKSLKTIYAPYNLSIAIDLPEVPAATWYRSDGTTVTELPQNLSYSVALGKNYIPDEKEIKPTVENVEITKDKLTVVIHDENTKKGIEGAVVTVNNTPYTTSADGIALINASDEKVRTEITVTAEGYEDSTTASDVFNGMVIHIFMISRSDELRVTMAYADMNGKKYDLLREKIVLGYYSDINKISSQQSTVLYIDIEANREVVLYELLSRDDAVIMQNTSGNLSISAVKGGQTEDGGTITANMPLVSVLKPGKYRLRVTDENGQTATVGIGLTSTASYLTEERMNDSGKFSLGDSLEVQIPDDVPLIGGGTYKFGLEDKLPVEISIDGDGKLKVAFNKPLDQDFNEYKENYKKLSKKAKNASQLASQFGHVQGFSAGYFDIDGSICGYGEGNISELDEGTITIKVGVIAELEGTGKYKQYFMAGFVPVNVFVEGKASVSADANASVPVKNWKITGLDLSGGSLTGKVGMTVGGGIGVGVELNASGNGNVNYTWKPAKKYQKAWLEASMKVEAVVLWWTEPLWESKKFKYVLLEKGEEGRSMSDAASVQNAGFVRMSRNYLDHSEGYLHMMSAGINSADGSYRSADGKTMVKAAIYPSASPVMTQVGSTRYLFWVEDVASRSANNIGAIVYSTSQDGVTWTGPKRLISELEDSTFDGSFDVFASGQKIYVTWQDGTSVLEDSAAMQQVLQSMTIRRAVLDTQTEEVTVTENLTKESGYYMYPCTVVQAGACYTAYVHNTLDSGDVYGKNTQSLCCVKEGNAQPERFSLPENGIVVNMTSGIFDNRASIVCEIDMDGNLSTSEDREIYLWDMADGSQTRLTNNATADSVPVISDSGSVYWYQDGNIMQLKSKSANAQGIWSEGSLAAPVNFNVVTDRTTATSSYGKWRTLINRMGQWLYMEAGKPEMAYGRVFPSVRNRRERSLPAPVQWEIGSIYRSPILKAFFWKTVRF